MRLRNVLTDLGRVWIGTRPFPTGHGPPGYKIQTCDKIDLLKNESSFSVAVEEILGPEFYLQIDFYVISFDACLSP